MHTYILMCLQAQALREEVESVGQRSMQASQRTRESELRWSNDLESLTQELATVNKLSELYKQGLEVSCLIFPISIAGY